jgi:hypothetical protein
MSADQALNPWDGATLPPGGASRSDRPHRRPALRVRAVDGTAVADIINAETLYAEEDISHLANCEPTAHRLVSRVILPTPHRRAEGRREPPVAAPMGVG